MYAPVALWCVGRPDVLGSKGHRIIQCGPTVMGASVLSYGSESLRCVAPASMYSIPGTVVVGLGLCSAKSRVHCIATLSSHSAGFPGTFGFPGKHVKSFVPWRRIFILPCASTSATVASFVTLGGPADSARAILLTIVSFRSESGAFEDCAKAPMLMTARTSGLRTAIDLTVRIAIEFYCSCTSVKQSNYQLLYALKTGVAGRFERRMSSVRRKLFNAASMCRQCEGSVGRRRSGA